MMPVMVKVYSRFIDQAIISVGDKEVVKGLIYSFVVLALMKLYEYFNCFFTYLFKNQFRLRFTEKFTQSVLEKVSRLDYRKIEPNLPKVLYIGFGCFHQKPYKISIFSMFFLYKHMYK